jgi:hypothetical protein
VWGEFRGIQAQPDEGIATVDFRPLADFERAGEQESTCGKWNLNAGG